MALEWYGKVWAVKQPTYAALDDELLATMKEELAQQYPEVVDPVWIIKRKSPRSKSWWIGAKWQQEGIPRRDEEE